MVGWQYDQAGNLTDDGRQQYRYDALNRLAGVTTNGATSPQTTMQYNGDGVLVAQTQHGSLTRFTQDLVAPLSQVLQTSNGSANTTYVYGLDRLASIRSGTWTWSVTDVLGSVRLTLYDAGRPQTTSSFDPWGQPTTGILPTPFGFTGEWQDTSTGLVNLRARWYQPQTGRFLGRDPFPGWADQPYSQHPYQYGYSNPVLYTDPSGLCIPQRVPILGEPGCEFLGWDPRNWNYADGAAYVDEAVISPIKGIAQGVQSTIDVVRGDPKARRDLRNGWNYAWDHPEALGKLLVSPFIDIYEGIVCHDPNQLGRGLTGFGLWLGGPKAVRGSARWLRGQYVAGQRLGIISDIGPYGKLSRRLKGSGEQANHLNQNAAYRDVIPENEGVAAPMRGNAFTEPGTPHYKFHQSIERWWDEYRAGGSKFGSRPTNAEYSRALNKALQEAGYSADDAAGLESAARANREAYGLTDADPVPRVPRKITQRP